LKKKKGGRTQGSILHFLREREGGRRGKKKGLREIAKAPSHYEEETKRERNKGFKGRAMQGKTRKLEEEEKRKGRLRRFLLEGERRGGKSAC